MLFKYYLYHFQKEQDILVQNIRERRIQKNLTQEDSEFIESMLSNINKKQVQKTCLIFYKIY